MEEMAWVTLEGAGITLIIATIIFLIYLLFESWLR